MRKGIVALERNKLLTNEHRQERFIGIGKSTFIVRVMRRNSRAGTWKYAQWIVKLVFEKLGDLRRNEATIF
jgi:hypothetical protein